MLVPDARFADAVTQTVGRLERATDAEVIVVAAPRSGSYTDVAIAFGAAVAWLLLVFQLFSPFSFAPVAIAVELPLVAGIVAWAASRSPPILRVLTRNERRRRQVEEAAAAAFHEEAVAGTRGRTGVLVYLSALEDRIVLVPDAGIAARVPGAEWNGIRWGPGPDPRAPGDLEHFIAGLDAVGAVLARHVPPTESNPNEIADAPRIRT